MTVNELINELIDLRDRGECGEFEIGWVDNEYHVFEPFTFVIPNKTDYRVCLHGK